VSELPTRGEADHSSLTLLGRYGDAGSNTLERELVNGEAPGYLSAEPETSPRASRDR
jgi:hypothetical protein